MSYPRVLLFGQSFNDFSGGGITLSKLFKCWPIECLAVVSYPYMLHNSSNLVCRNYYQIGMDEMRWKFPFSILKQKFPSGKLNISNHSRLSVLKKTKTFRHSLSYGIVNPAIRWAGLIHSVSSIHISPVLINWLSDYDPEILYLQISNRESINFARELIDYLKIPSVIHMMDDWPSTISNQGPFKKYWYGIIDHEFRALLDKTDLHLSISTEMSEEYLNRYGKRFIPFHNSIESGVFNVETKVQKSEANKFRILYVGRIGTANRRSLLNFAESISKFNFPGFDIELFIYTKDHECSDAQRIGKFKKVRINKAVDHNDIPGLLISYDLLLLPLDFTKSGLKFSRLSMPTKAIEYMASGTPILVYAPSETAIYKFCHRYECAHCISSLEHQELSGSLLKLFTDSEYRDKIILNAKHISQELFDGDKVRQEFRSIISDLVIGQRNRLK